MKSSGICFASLRAKPRTAMNYQTILALVPILEKMEGYAMQHEPVRGTGYSDGAISLVEFPNGEMRKVSGGWVLSVNSTPIAVFPL